MGTRWTGFFLLLITLGVVGFGAPSASAQVTVEEQALYDETADLVQAELDLLLELGGDRDAAARAELAQVEAAGLAIQSRYGPVLALAPRVADVLGPFPNGVDTVEAPNAEQRSLYEGAVAELRAGLPTANNALATGVAPPDRPGNGDLRRPATVITVTEGSSAPTLPLLAGLTVVLLVAAAFAWKRFDDQADLRELAHTDELTQVFNRRRLEADLVSHAERAGRLAVAMVDIDLFKQLNDTYGHPAGDAVLREVAATIGANLRESDVVYRYGGEEFCILLPATNDNEAFQVVERVRGSVEALDLRDVAGPVTVSVGVALGATDRSDDTLRDADSALYAAKRGGRNRVVQHAPVYVARPPVSSDAVVEVGASAADLFGGAR